MRTTDEDSGWRLRRGDTIAAGHEDSGWRLRSGLAVALLLLVLLMAACAAGQPTGPQVQGTALADRPAGVLGLLAVDTPTATPSPTPSPTPTSTPTPLPTPTPLAALSVGSLPAGQVLFSTQRAGETGEQLWLVSADAGLAELRSDLLPGGWRCAPGQQAGCAFAAVDQGLFLLRPVTATAMLLDDLTPLLAEASAMPISPTLAITAAAALSPMASLTSTGSISPSNPLTLTIPLTFTSTTDLPAAAAYSSTISPILAFSPDGQRLAVAAADRVIVYDLAGPAVLATLDAGGPAELAWSPDGARLALAYPAGEGNAIALWSLADGQMPVLAQMEAAGRLAWSPDGSKLAFDARTSPATPSSQSGQPDVYVLNLRSGEIYNLTELFPRNREVGPAQQIGGWAPQWEPDGETVRYVRGIPGQIEEQTVMRHALRSRTPTKLWPVADEGRLGVVADPEGQRLARVVLQDGRDVVQLDAGAGWQDATPGTFAQVAALAWGPPGQAGPRLLVADRQALLIVDPASGAISGLAVACPDCVVTQAVWLPPTAEQ